MRRGDAPVGSHVRLASRHSTPGDIKTLHQLPDKGPCPRSRSSNSQHPPPSLYRLIGSFLSNPLSRACAVMEPGTVIPILPVVRKTTRYSDSVCLPALHRVCRLLPCLAKRVEWADGLPSASPDIAASVIWIFLGKVTPCVLQSLHRPFFPSPLQLTFPCRPAQIGDGCKRSRLLEAGFTPATVHAAADVIAPLGDVPLFHTERSAAQLAHTPLLLLTGLPADMLPRELRLMVCCLPGFKAASLTVRHNVPMAYVWWDSEVAAQCALVTLKHLILDAACPCPMRVSFHRNAALLTLPPTII